MLFKEQIVTYLILWLNVPSLYIHKKAPLGAGLFCTCDLSVTSDLACNVPGNIPDVLLMAGMGLELAGRMLRILRQTLDG